MSSVKRPLDKATQRRGLILERRAGESFFMSKGHFRVGVTLVRAGGGSVAVGLDLPVLGEVVLHVDVRGNNKAGFQIACEDDVFLIREEKDDRLGASQQSA